MNLPLAARAEEVYEHILSYVSTHGYGPTFRELSTITGISLAYLHRIVGELRNTGALVSTDRGIIYPTRRTEDGTKHGGDGG